MFFRKSVQVENSNLLHSKTRLFFFNYRINWPRLLSTSWLRDARHLKKKTKSFFPFFFLNFKSSLLDLKIQFTVTCMLWSDGERRVVLIMEMVLVLFFYLLFLLSRWGVRGMEFKSKCVRPEQTSGGQIWTNFMDSTELCLGGHHIMVVGEFIKQCITTTGNLINSFFFSTAVWCLNRTLSVNTILLHVTIFKIFSVIFYDILNIWN